MSVLDMITASGSVRNKKLYIRNRRVFNQQVALLDERWELDITIQRRRATRSVQSNRYYFGVVLAAISDHTGYSIDETHDLCKMLHLPRHLAVLDGNGDVKGEYVLGGSTRKLNVQQFTDYIERIRQWASETLDVYIPDAGEMSPASTAGLRWPGRRCGCSGKIRGGLATVS